MAFAETGQPFAACAANLAFAIELYLKALLASLDLPVPQSHDLRALFDALPQAVRFTVEEVYMWQVPRDLKALGHRGCFVLATGPPEMPRPRFGSSSNNVPILPDLLEGSKDLLQSWRYLGEFSPPDGSAYRFREFDYGLLRVAAEAMRVEVMVRLHEAGVITLPDGAPWSHANKNSFVLNSLIVSLNFAAFSNSNRLAASRISLSSFAMKAFSSSCDLNSGMPSASTLVRSA